jgi:hypothetical protein
MIVILIVTESTHILEGIKSKKDPPIPSLDDDDFANKAYNYYKKVTCGSKGAKKATDIFKEIHDAPKEQQDEKRKKYNIWSILTAAVFNDVLCINKTLTAKDFGEMGKKMDENACEDTKRVYTEKDKVPKEIQNLNKKYLTFVNKTSCA